MIAPIIIEERLTSPPSYNFDYQTRNKVQDRNDNGYIVIKTDRSNMIVIPIGTKLSSSAQTNRIDEYNPVVPVINAISNEYISEQNPNYVSLGSFMGESQMDMNIRKIKSHYITDIVDHDFVLPKKKKVMNKFESEFKYIPNPKPKYNYSYEDEFKDFDSY